MKVVIDSNVLLNAIYPQSKNYWILQALQQQQLTLCVTTDILDEYAEVFEDYYDVETANLFLSAIEILPNILYIIGTTSGSLFLPILMMKNLLTVLLLPARSIWLPMIGILIL